MADVIMPEKKSGSKGLLQAGGAAVGAYFGGPQGAAMGYQAGGTIADATSKNRQVAQVKSDAMARRAEGLKAQQPPAQDDYSKDLEAAEAAAAQLPEGEREKYLPTIQRAREMSLQQRRTME